MPELSNPQSSTDDGTIFDVAVIGAGAVGSAIARELSRFELKVALLEAASDVGMGTSKASTALWHTGFDAEPGSLEAALLRRGYPLLESFMQEVGSPYERLGGLLIAWSEEELGRLPLIHEKARKNGDLDSRLLTGEEVYALEPNLAPGALGAMFVPREGILCTFTIPLACATQAVLNGVTLKLNFRVGSVRRAEGVYSLSAGKDEVHTRWVINAAGLYSDEINAHFGHGGFSIKPRRGQLIVFDKLARSLLTHVLLPVPTALTKGVMISPTIYGNVLLGPTAEDLSDRTATNTSSDGLRYLQEKGRRILPALLDEEVTATYAGLRAATEHGDYQIALHPGQHYVCVGGIRSTGISACLGIAEHIRELLEDGGLKLRPKSDFKPVRMPNIGEAFPRPYQSAELVAKNPEYGTIVCHCERVTLGELRDAVKAPIPAGSLDALRRRTRAMQGRCQGFNCHAALLETLRTGGRNSTIPAQLKEGEHRPPPSISADVLIIGAGPAGISAALELRRRGIRDVLIVEREPEAGGIPRMCGHTGFGVRDLKRVLTGPSYARHYRDLAARASIMIKTSTTITGWEDTLRVSFTSPNGIGSIEARAILLATGVRERPRAARLVPGTRPQGVFTTGSLQRFVYEHHLPVGERAVIIGAERVSLSVVLTLLHARTRVRHLVTDLPRHQLYGPVFWPAKILLADILARASVLANRRVTNMLGRHRLEGIEVTDLRSGKAETIECDTAVFTGSWIPENELPRRGGIQTGLPRQGPQVDADFRTSQPGVFAAGNMLRGVETADRAALEGQAAGRSIHGFLKESDWPVNRVSVNVEGPLDWICPSVLTPESRARGFRFQSREFRQDALLRLAQGGRVLYQERIAHLRANTPLNLGSTWVERVDPAGESVVMSVL